MLLRRYIYRVIVVDFEGVGLVESGGGHLGKAGILFILHEILLYLNIDFTQLLLLLIIDLFFFAFQFC